MVRVALSKGFLLFMLIDCINVVLYVCVFDSSHCISQPVSLY